VTKLLKLREWLTVKEAAKYLSVAAEEDVTEADILRLGLDGHLTLSVNFVNHARGRPLRIEPLDEQPEVSELAEEFLAMHPTPKASDDGYKIRLTHFLRTYRGELLPNGKEILIFEGDGQKPEQLEGIWDLLMLGAEALDVEHEYQNLTGGPSVELVCLGGPLVSNPDRTRAYQIQDSYLRENKPSKPVPLPKVRKSKEVSEALDRVNAIIGSNAKAVNDPAPETKWNSERVYYPAAGLPKDSTLIVRTAALRELESKLLTTDLPPEKPLHPSERRSISQIISVLSAMAGIDLSTPYAADETMRAAAAQHGLELPSSPETVAKYLRNAGENS